MISDWKLGKEVGDGGYHGAWVVFIYFILFCWFNLLLETSGV